VKEAMKLLAVMFALVLASEPATAFACEYDHDEEYVFANARVIYIGKVVAVTDLQRISETYFATSTVKPLKAVKGTLPREQRALSAMRPPYGCGSHGDGDGAFEAVGTLVFVFEGLPSPGNYPRGIQSFAITQGEKPELLEHISRMSEEDLRR
jgi:hypothetical protein